MRNRYPGPCAWCGAEVPAGRGRVRFIGRVPQGAEHYSDDPACNPRLRTCCGVAINRPCECAANWRAEYNARAGVRR